MEVDPTTATSLLDLPDKTLLAILQFCVDEPCSLFNAARASSKLHELSAAALTSITAEVTQQQSQSLQLYMSRYSQHVKNLRVIGMGIDPVTPAVQLADLPSSMQLDSLCLQYLQLQLLPGNGRQGILLMEGSIYSLEVDDCAVLDGPHGQDALADALVLLPGLRQLKYRGDTVMGSCLQASFLPKLQHLTRAELMDIDGDVLRYVEQLTNLQHLSCSAHTTSSEDGGCKGPKFSVLHQLTFLHLLGGYDVELASECLANTGNLQHLALQSVHMADGPAGAAALLRELQHMQQLTHLTLAGWYNLCRLGRSGRNSSPSAAAFAALTASSKLQHLDVCNNTMPPSMWQHVLPAGTQLSLQVLRASECNQSSFHSYWVHTDSMRLVSCCPDLQQLVLHARPWQLLPADALVPLSGLSALQMLVAGELDDAGFAAVAQLTGLQELHLMQLSDATGMGLPQHSSATDMGLLHLTQLKQATELAVLWSGGGHRLSDQGPEEPVWLQVLQLSLDSNQPEVAQLAQQAMASLELECLAV